MYHRYGGLYMSSDLFYSKVFFEISDTCNALCPWCERGSRNRKIRPPISNVKSRGDKFIPLELFVETIDFLLSKGLIKSRMSEIYLYNWGEPLLHPQFYDILDFLRSRKLFVGISTNGSIVLESKVLLDHVNLLCISMPGFTQQSYDRVHGFSFKKIVHNIKSIVENAKKSGCYPDNIRLYAHKYKQNKDEIKPIMAFAEYLGIKVMATSAFFNCFEYSKQYIQNTMPEHILKQARRDLFLLDREHFVKPETPFMSKINCNQWRILTLSHRGRPSVCCGVDLESEAYELFDFKDHPHITYEKINEIRKNHHFCQLCRHIGGNRTG